MMQKERISYLSEDGKSTIQAVRYLPENGEIIGVLQIIHGLSEYVERFEEVASFMTERGFVVTGNDHLGHGKTLQKDQTPGYFCEKDSATVVINDVHSLKKMTKELYPDVPYIMLGHSMGSFIIRNYICQYSDDIDAAIISGTGMQGKALIYSCKLIAKIQNRLLGPKHVNKFLNYMTFDVNAKGFKPARTNMDWLSKDEERVDRYINDPLCGFPFTINGFLGLFDFICRLYNTENLKRISKDLPIFIVSGKDDPVGNFGKGPQKLCGILKGLGLEKVDLKLYENVRHEWYNEPEKEEVMQSLYEWIMKTMGA